MHTVLAKALATVLAALLLGLLAILRVPVFRSIEILWSLFRLVLVWMLAPFPVPRIFVLACLTAALVIMTRRRRHRSLSAQPVKPSWRDYREDVFLGLVWRWTYDSSGQPGAICPFCPQCDLQLSPRVGAFHMSTELRCDRCQRERLSYDQDWPGLIARIILEIQRTLRSGEWEYKTRRE